MRPWLLATMLALSGLAAGPATSATIGVVAPTSGSYALLGAQVLAGARAAAEETGDTLVEINEVCDDQASPSAADQLIEAQAVAAIGFLCSETLSIALPQLSTAAIPAITLSVRSEILMEDALREDWPLFRLAPNEGDEAERISEVILQRWKAEPVALIEDGTIYGRELLSAVRRQIEENGLTPVFVDTYRPGQEQQLALVRRLAKAGAATRVFVGGDRNDVSVIARDAASENVPLLIMGGDTLRAADRPVPLQEGVMAVAIPDYADLPSASAAAAQFRSNNVEPEGYTIPAYAAVQVVSQAAAASASQPLSEELQSMTFETVIGPLSFGDDHELAQNPLRLQEWRDGRFVPVEVPTD
ncbi:branched-chain amino acid transport system substrate-binding protein [Pseudorhizobium tarimense]|uniref:Branched-chain amino acid transport system substrate-binding protein n=2 Tax=Pseudorhizobium tarimense TaxID=1079109 RepID=A0ABV2H2N0_9HYPH